MVRANLCWLIHYPHQLLSGYGKHPVHGEVTLNSWTKKSIKYSYLLTQCHKHWTTRAGNPPVMWVWNPTSDQLMRGDSVRLINNSPRYEDWKSDTGSLLQQRPKWNCTVEKHIGLRIDREGRGFSPDRSNLVGTTKPQYRVFYDLPLAYQNQWDFGSLYPRRDRLKLP